MDIGKNTTLGDCYSAEEFVELLVIADSELDVTWDDASLLVVTGGVAGKLEDLGSEVLKDGSEVHWGAGTDAGGVFALLQEASHSSDWELKAGLR